MWKSGQVGAVTTHAKEHSSRNKHAGINLSEKKIKVKFLTPVSEKGSVLWYCVFQRLLTFDRAWSLGLFVVRMFNDVP